MASQFLALPLEGSSGGVTSLNSLTGDLTLVAGTGISITPSGSNITIANTGAGAGTVSSVSVVSANGLAGTVANPTTTPALTLSTTITGILQGNGTAISAATTGNLTDVGTDGIVVTGGTGAVLGSGASIAQHVADTTHNGYLASADWNTFNGKQSALTFSDSLVNTSGTVTLVNDSASPGNSKYYGTNGSGTLGYFSLGAGTGTVTSVAMSVPSFLSVSGSPITTSGTLAVTLSGTALPVVNGGTGLTSTTANQLLYSSATSTIAGLATANNGTLITSSGGVPSISSTLPSAVQGNITSLGTVTSGVWNATCTAGYQIPTGTTWTTPAGITANTQFKISLIGGGGGGGGSSNTANTAGAGGGGGGVIVLYTTGLAASNGYTIAIGSAGAGSSNANGTNGGNTTLTIGGTTYTAGGGTGGNAGVSNQGGAGGTCTNGTILIPGQAGGPSAAASTSGISGVGGCSGLGWGLGGAGLQSNGVTGGTTGLAGLGYGAGGGGSKSGATTATAEAGGNGTVGFILVEWWN